MAVTITLASTNNGSLSSSTLTLTSAGIGTVGEKVIAIVSMGAGTVSSMTVAGFGAQLQVASTKAASPFASIYTVKIPTGSSSTANIVVTSTVATGAMGFGIFTITANDSASINSSKVTAATAGADSLTTGALTVNASAAGLAGYVAVSALTTALNWTNATKSFQNTATVKYTVATISSAATGLTISCSNNTTSVASVLVAVTFNATVPTITLAHEKEYTLPKGLITNEIVSY